MTPDGAIRGLSLPVEIVSDGHPVVRPDRKRESRSHAAPGSPEPAWGYTGRSTTARAIPTTSRSASGRRNPPTGTATRTVASDDPPRMNTRGAARRCEPRTQPRAVPARFPMGRQAPAPRRARRGRLPPPRAIARSSARPTSAAPIVMTRDIPTAAATTTRDAAPFAPETRPPRHPNSCRAVVEVVMPTESPKSQSTNGTRTEAK